MTPDEWSDRELIHVPGGPLLDGQCLPLAAPRRMLMAVAELRQADVLSLLLLDRERI
jgi:hypothetical protein